MFGIKKFYGLIVISSTISFLEFLFTTWELVKVKNDDTLVIKYFKPNFNAPYETARRALNRAIFEEHQAYQEYLERLKKSNHNIDLTNIEDCIHSNYLETSALIDQFRTFDGLESQRNQALKSVQDEIQEKLKALQNPVNCKQASVLICEGKVNSRQTQSCGWGCMVHFAAKCLQAAYSSQRTMILNASFFGLDQYFMPLSDTCQDSDLLQDTTYEWPYNMTEKIVKMHQFSNYKGHYPAMRGLPPFLPQDLIDRIHWITPDPEKWFTGQFVSYLLRLKDERLKSSKKLAIHVRRGDKIQEAYFYDVSKYLNHIEDHLQVQKCKNSKMDPKPSLFVATDDQTALQDANSFASDFVIFGNETAAELASDILQRFTPETHYNVVQDFFQLANSTHLVCTLSSNLCRLAYEYKLANAPYLMDLYQVVSLDLNPFGDYDRQYVANHDRILHQDLQFTKGDMIYVHKTKNQLPKRYFGSLKLSGRDPMYFLRSSVTKILYSSDLFP